MNHAANMVDRLQELDHKKIAYLTKIQEGKLTIGVESNAPLLNRPRVTVTAPRGTPLSHIREMFATEEVYEMWYKASGEMHVSKQNLEDDRIQG